MVITFLHPSVLWVLPVVVLYVWGVWRGGVVGGAATRRRVMLVVRLVVTMLLILALARPQLVRPADEVCVVALVDGSKSIPPEGVALANSLLNALRSRARGSGRDLLVYRFDEGSSRTNLASALRVGAALVPSGVMGRLLLVSDGRQTVGSALAAAAEVRAAGLRLYTTVVAPPARREVALLGLSAPAVAEPNSTIPLTLRLFNAQPQRVRLSIYRSGLRLVERVVECPAGESEVHVEADVGAEGGPVLFSALCRASLDTNPRNNRASVVVVVRARPRLLLIEAEEGGERWLHRALSVEGFDVVPRPPEGLPDTPLELNSFDLVVLGDVPARRFRLRQLEALVGYVRELGGGLLVVGGESGFAAGGYGRTPLAEVLPVRLEVHQREGEPSLALVLAIDRSGSMNSERKIDLAKEAAIAAVEVLSPADQVAVVAFSGAAHVLLPLQRVGRGGERRRIAAVVARLRASGGTDIASALREAYRILRDARVRLKHVILLSDGYSNPADFEAIVSRMSAEGITVSTVAVGSSADTDLLRRIARWGGGRAYFTADPFNIPQIFVRETARVARRAFVEEPFRPLLQRPSDLVRGLDFTSAPPLLGYCLTRTRSEAETVLRSPPRLGFHPLLARWRVGLGRVTAFTSDARNRWAAEWLTTPLFVRFWTQLARATMRRGWSGGRWRLVVSPGGGRLRLTLDLLDLRDRFIDGLRIGAHLVGPDEGGGRGRLGRVYFRQVAPGRYRAEVPLRLPGAYAVQTFIEGEGEEASPTGNPRMGPAGGFVLPGSSEVRFPGPDVEFMRLLASVGGGELLDPKDPTTLDHLFTLEEEEGNTAGVGRESRDLWPILVVAALALFPVDLFLKRLPLPWWFRRRVAAETRGGGVE